MSLNDILRGGIIIDKPSGKIAEYTSSILADEKIKKYVIDIVKAHVVMLTERNILKENESSQILKVLNELTDFKLDPMLEDIHMNLESYIISKLGYSIGGNVNIAKSRNDQVATAIRMALRSELLNIAFKLIGLRKAILKRCCELIDAVMPGYTHLQHAQPITVSHLLLAHHDRLKRDIDRIKEVYSRVNISPMGAAALATSSFNIDRFRVAELLGFNGLVENSIDAVSSRDFIAEAVFTLSLIMTNLSSFAEEIILWNTLEFGFINLPDELVSTSSIMPQKRNPVIAELVRAKTGSIYGDLTAILTILKALPLSYNLDLQEVTPHLWSACSIVSSTLDVMIDTVLKMKFNTDRLIETVRKGMSVATELANLLVRSGISFRESHRIVGSILRDRNTLIADEIVEALSKYGVNVSIDDVSKILNPVYIVDLHSVIGGPSPGIVSKAINVRLKALVEDEEYFNNLAKSLKEYELKLSNAVANIINVNS
ncbi:MAG: argininosuccinate lyase [Candidatus Methanomethylicia archaeon]